VRSEHTWHARTVRKPAARVCQCFSATGT
jgi:hypothetical protein